MTDDFPMPPDEKIDDFAIELANLGLLGYVRLRVGLAIWKLGMAVMPTELTQVMLEIPEQVYEDYETLDEEEPAAEDDDPPAAWDYERLVYDGVITRSDYLTMDVNIVRDLFIQQYGEDPAEVFLREIKENEEDDDA